MAKIILPQAQLSQAPESQKLQSQADLIIKILGQNPYAQAIDQIGPKIEDALALRAQRRKQAQQIAEYAALTGNTPPPKESSLDINMYSDALKRNLENEKLQENIRKEAQKRIEDINKIRALEKQFGYKENELGDDHASALLKVKNDLAIRRQQNGSQEENRKLREQQFSEKQLTKYSDTLEKTGIPSAISVASNVLSLLPERGKDIPGYGVFDSLRPDILSGDKGRELRQAIFQLFNIELKDRSGAAVVDSELNRLKREYGQGRMGTEESLRTGLRQYLNRLQEVARNVEAGYPANVKNSYKEGGGRDILDSINTLIQKPSIKLISIPTTPKDSVDMGGGFSYKVKSK